MKNVFSSTRLSKRSKILTSLAALALIFGLAAAAIFTMFYTTNTATARTPDIRLVAGNDNIGGSTYPTASVTVASTYDFATVGFSMFPSQTNTPQPATYYTNLLNITNYGTASHNITSISIIDLTGKTNLGNITIYYYATQTDNPTAATAIGSYSITSASPTTIPIFTGTQTIAAAETQYIEVVAYAAPTAAPSSQVTFTLTLQWT